MKVVDAVAKVLKTEGVEYLFAYPVNPIIEAAAKLDIRPYYCSSRTYRTPHGRRDEPNDLRTTDRCVSACKAGRGPKMHLAALRKPMAILHRLSFYRWDIHDH